MTMTAIPFQLDRDSCERLINRALESGGDFAEVFCEYSTAHALSFEEGKVKNASSTVRCGIGIRVFCGEAVGLAYCETGDMQDLLRCARQAGQIARNSDNVRSCNAFARTLDQQFYPSVNPSSIFRYRNGLKFLSR